MTMTAGIRRGLGTGLDALFGESYPDNGENVRTLPISKVEPRENQPRAHFDEVALAELAESIKEYGLIQMKSWQLSLLWLKIYSGKT